VTQETNERQQKLFDKLKVWGMVVNFLPTPVLCYSAWNLELIIAQVNFKPWVFKWVFIADISNIVMHTISVIMLSWGLMRIRDKVRRSDDSKLNIRLMCLHLTIIVTSLIFAIALFYLIHYCLKHRKFVMLSYVDIVFCLTLLLTELMTVIVLVSINNGDRFFFTTRYSMPIDTEDFGVETLATSYGGFSRQRTSSRTSFLDSDYFSRMTGVSRGT
jgi:hypothetical protein